MQSTPTPSLNIARGLLATMVSAVLAVILVATLSAGFLWCKWTMAGARRADRDYDIRDALDRLPGPTLICAVLAGVAGWVTFAPRASSRFAINFAIAAAASLILWFVIGLFELIPRRVRSVEHPFMYPSEAFIFFGVPVAMAFVLTIKRLKQSEQMHD